MARECRSIDRPHNPLYFSEKRLPWNEGSRCSICEVWVRLPTYAPIDFGLATIQGPNEGKEHYYNINGKRSGVLIILPVKKLARRDLDGTFLQTITELVSKVKCRCCGTVCRGRPHEKRKRKRNKQISKYENTIPESVKIKQIDDIIKGLKTQVEYENDPSLRLDDPEAKKAGTLSSMIRPYVQTTLEELERLRNKIQPKNESKSKNQHHISKEQQEVINRRNEAQARILYVKVKREIKQLEEKLGREIQFVPIVDIIEEDKDDGAETEGKEPSHIN